MTHRAAFYRVQIRPKNQPNGWRLLGDYDEQGTSAANTIRDTLTDLNMHDKDRKTHVRFDETFPKLGDDHVGISILSGRSNVTSVISKEGDPDFLRTPEHSETMRLGILYYLPHKRKNGWLAIHSPHGRGCKTIIDRVVSERFRVSHYMIEISPIIPRNALKEAVDRNRVKAVTLIKRDPTKTDKFHDAAQWGDDEVDQVTLKIQSKRKFNLRPTTLSKFLHDPSDKNRKQIIEFKGLEFDNAGITVNMPDGSQRTFYIETPERGHAMTLALQISDEDEYGASSHDISIALKDALNSVAFDE